MMRQGPQIQILSAEDHRMRTANHVDAGASPTDVKILARGENLVAAPDEVRSVFRSAGKGLKQIARRVRNRNVGEEKFRRVGKAAGGNLIRRERIVGERVGDAHRSKVA